MKLQPLTQYVSGSEKGTPAKPAAIHLKRKRKNYAGAPPLRVGAGVVSVPPQTRIRFRLPVFSRRLLPSFRRYQRLSPLCAWRWTPGLPCFSGDRECAGFRGRVAGLTLCSLQNRLVFLGSVINQFFFSCFKFVASHLPAAWPADLLHFTPFCRSDYG